MRSPIASYDTDAFATGNNPPVANNDSVLTKENTPITIDVLANDTDSDGDSLKITSVTQPSHGHVALNLGFVTKWGTTGSSEGQLNFPLGIATDSAGNIYVADTNNNRIQKFDRSGIFITSWGSSGIGNSKFNFPTGIAIDQDDNVYVADSQNNRVQKFDTNGNFITKWGSPCLLAIESGCADPDGIGPLSLGDGQFYYPLGIAVNQDGNVYVSDIVNHRIQKFDSNGNFITKWGSAPGYGQLNAPMGIAVDSSGNVYVSDWGNYQILKFDTNGNFIKKWGSVCNSEALNGQFCDPRGIALDSNDNVYVADTGHNRIQKFDTNGNFITKWGTDGTADGQFQYPAGVAVDPSGDVYVADADNNRIQKFSNTGVFLTKWGNDLIDGQLSLPGDIAVDSFGNAYVVESNSNRIQKFDTNGNFITKWAGKSGYERLIIPTHIEVDSSDNVYVTDVDNYSINKFDNNGNFLTKWGSLCVLDSLTECADPDGIGPLSLGDGQFYFIRGIAIDSNDDVYVADNQNNRVQKFDTNGNFITKWGTHGTADGQFQYATGVAVDSIGNVYVADTSSGRIQKFDTNGNFITKWGTPGIGDDQFVSLEDIAVDSSGNVYVADNQNNRVQKFDTNGNFITKWGTHGTADGQFQYPFGIQVDSTGNIYVADTGNNRIQKFESAKLLYEPDLAFVGTDSFTYTVSDILGSTSSATVFVKVSDAPFITGMVADDPDPRVVGYSNGDTITVKFSEPTNTSFKEINNHLTKTNLDALFSFSQNGNPASLGTDYTGKWLTNSTLLITIVNTTSATPPAVSNFTLAVKESANLKNFQGTSLLASTFTSPPLSGNFDGFRASANIVDRTASTLLPAGTTAQIELPGDISGTVEISRKSLNTTARSGATLAFVGTVVDISPPASACLAGCKFRFILDGEDLANAGVTLGTLRIFHDKNGDGDVADSGETLVPKIQIISPTGPFIVSVRETSASTFALGGTEAAITIIQNIINNNGGHATASNFIISLLSNIFSETFVGSETGTPFALNDGTYKISDTAPAGYLFKSITGQGCPDQLGKGFQLAKGQGITCTITYDDSGITACVLPSSVDWFITTSCTLQSSFAPQGNVIVQNGAVLTIPSDVFLDIKFATNHLLVQSGSGVLIKAGGKIF